MTVCKYKMSDGCTLSKVEVSGIVVDRDSESPSGFYVDPNDSAS